MSRIKAVGLISGGLDSTLAAKLMLDQGVDVIALNFKSPFCQHDGREALEVAKRLDIPLHIVSANNDYLRILRKPRYGFGSGMNPCIDCKILMLKTAKRLARKMGARFIFTGEVLGQRPMSQHRRALDNIDKEAGLEGKLLRPLSAKLLPPTEAEERGWVDREKLRGVRGRSRRSQIALASNMGVSDYPLPAGGCLLTEKEFAVKLRDLLNHRRRVNMRDIVLLRYGRHFRLGDNKIIVGRDEAENKALSAINDGTCTYLEVPNCGSPVTLLQGRLRNDSLLVAARLTARYSDAKGDKITVNYRRGWASGSIIVEKMRENEISCLRISASPRL